MTTKAYENGRIAVRFGEDGTGFIYYPNGSVALCCNDANEYQKRFYAFDKDRKNTLLFGIDEHGVGGCSGSKRKGIKGNTPELALTKVGGLITNAEGQITHTWKWDRNAQNAGEPPKEEIIFRLNEHLTFFFRNLSDMRLEFEYDAVKFELNTGVKYKRSEPSYIVKAKKGMGGKLIPQINHVTLQQRTAAFGKEMAAQRNKLHPNSKNLSSMVQGIVSSLENDFDNIHETLKMPATDGATWKSEALNQTLRELPRIPLAGVETGISPGFSQTLYVPPEDCQPLAKTVRFVNPFFLSLSHHFHVFFPRYRPLRGCLTLTAPGRTLWRCEQL
jgi:hypothetical protein